MSNYVYSTLTSDNAYTSYTKGLNDLPTVRKKVLIKGGHGVANKNLITPRGVVTNVSDDELAHLEENEDFKRHVKNGFITVQKREILPEKVIADMVTRDASAPMVPQDYDEKTGDKETAAKPIEIKKAKL